VGLATGQSADPTALAWRFSPISNEKSIPAAEQLRVLVVGTLGNKRSAAARTYDRLMAYTQHVRETTPLLDMGTEWENLERAIEDINQHPLKQNAIARLNREFKAGISDEQLAKLVTFLREHDALCVINPEERRDGAQIICSMG